MSDEIPKNFKEYYKGLEYKIEELEKKGTNHNDSIIELRNLIQGNAISDLNHYEVNKNQFNSLKEQHEALDRICQFMFNKAAGEIEKLEEVLRSQYKFRIIWSEKAIFVDGAERLSSDQVVHLRDQIKFYGKLLAKLDGKEDLKDFMRKYHDQETEMDFTPEDRLPGGTGNKPREKDKELYELYLKDNDQYYFKKITHPFTEYNNMVNLGIGEMRVKREDLEFLIKSFINIKAWNGSVHNNWKRIKEEYGID